MENTQKINRKDLNSIYPKVCQDWQNKIAEIALATSGDELEVDNELINKAYHEANSTQIKLLDKYFKKISNKIQDKLNTWEKILEEIDEEEKDFVPFFGVKKLSKEQKSIQAQAKLFKVAELYNEGKTLDWTNSNQYKWRPYKYFSGGGFVFFVYGWDAIVGGPSGLHYINKELAEASLNNFKDLWNDYYII